MNLLKFSFENKPRLGLIDGDKIIDITAPGVGLRAIHSNGHFQRLVEVNYKRPVSFLTKDVVFLPPIDQAKKIICVGVNFPDRNEEYKDGQEAPKYPSLFPRFAQGFVGHNQNLVRPHVSDQLDYEAEIVLVIGRAGRHISQSNALKHVAALTLCNEGTVRDWVRHAKFNVTQGKNFDNSASMGPYLVPFNDEAQIADIRLTAHVNGDLRQDDRTSRMIFNFQYLIHYISTFTTLEAGDMIVTGTPTGAGARLTPPQFLKPSDRITIEAEGIGRLENGVIQEG